MNTRVDSSLIGQHITLLSTVASTLLSIVAPAGRKHGTGDIGEAVVSEMSSSSAYAPRRMPVTNDERSPNPRHLNVEFGMSTSPSLPPSTGSSRSINVDRLHSGYEIITTSISDLAYQ